MASVSQVTLGADNLCVLALQFENTIVTTMSSFDRKAHWEVIYATKDTTQVSWFQPVPETSLDLISSTGLPKSARIIDVGGGDSYLTDHLLERGFRDLTVLDISVEALELSKQRLADFSDEVTWVVSDATEYVTDEPYDLWHDRAAFHFLTDRDEQLRYVERVRAAVKPGGWVIIGGFSVAGPTKCSGLPIHQHSEESLQALFFKGFEAVECFRVDHTTPGGTDQNFVFCRFKKLD